LTPQLTLSGVTSGAVYSVVITNGGASITSAPAALTIDGAPVVVVEPSSATNLAGTVATFSVQASGAMPLVYQWLKNGFNLADGNNISGSATDQLTLEGVSAADVGTYSVVVSNSSGSATSSGASLAVVNSSPYLSVLWHIGPGDAQPWMNISGATSVPNQRTIAYNALSNHLYVVSRSSNTTSNYVIYVLNATNGAFLYTLRTNGIQCNVGKGGIGLVGISVADDGAVYACNTAPDAAGSAGADATALFRVYRWANAHSNTIPALVFKGDPTGSTTPQRWGDNLTVRGAGTNTQILVDMTYFGASAGTNGYAAILTAGNSFMTNFVARWFTTTNFATTVGRSLEFDTTNSAIWQKTPGGPLFRTVFNPAISLGGTRIASTTGQAVSNLPADVMGVGLDVPHNLAAGVCSNGTATADSLNLYNNSSVDSAFLLSQSDFPTTPRAANGNRISQTFFKNDLVFSIDANNGVLVLQVKTPSALVRLTEFRKLPEGAFLMGYSNYSNAMAYAVHASTNLLNWSYLGMATQASPGHFQFMDLQATNLSHRFYQLRSP
jgi:hypothetical protein